MLKRLLIIGCVALCFSAALSRELQGKLVPPPEECEPGYEKGVAAQFFGLEQGKIMVAGGANFPDIPAAEGGRKVFYTFVYMLDNDKWQKIDSLLKPMAYEAFASITEDNRLITNALHKIPEKIDTIDIVSSANFPTHLVQPVAAADSNYIYLWGGFTHPTGVPVGGWRLDLKTKKWQKIAAPPTRNLTGAALTPYRNGFLVVGGVNRTIFQKALERRERMRTTQGAELEQLKAQDRDYMLMPPKNYKFNDRLLFYNPTTDRWKTLGRSEHLARAGAAAIIDTRERLIVTGGELKPGIRNPMTCIFDLKSLTP